MLFDPIYFLIMCRNFTSIENYFTFATSTCFKLMDSDPTSQECPLVSGKKLVIGDWIDYFISWQEYFNWNRISLCLQLFCSWNINRYFYVAKNLWFVIENSPVYYQRIVTWLVIFDWFISLLDTVHKLRNKKILVFKSPHSS